MKSFSHRVLAWPRPFAITPSNTTDEEAATAGGIYVGGAGNIVAVLQNGTTLTFSSVAAGTILPVVAIRVNSTGTTATNLVGLN